MNNSHFALLHWMGYRCKCRVVFILYHKGAKTITRKRVIFTALCWILSRSPMMVCHVYSWLMLIIYFNRSRRNPDSEILFSVANYCLDAWVYINLWKLLCVFCSLFALCVLVASLVLFLCSYRWPINLYVYGINPCDRLLHTVNSHLSCWPYFLLMRFLWWVCHANTDAPDWLGVNEFNSTSHTHSELWGNLERLAGSFFESWYNCDPPGGDNYSSNLSPVWLFCILLFILYLPGVGCFTCISRPVKLGFMSLAMTYDPCVVWFLDTDSPAGPEEDDHTAANDSTSYLPDKVCKHIFCINTHTHIYRNQCLYCVHVCFFFSVVRTPA